MAKLSEIAMERKRERDGMVTIYQLVQDFATIHRNVYQKSGFLGKILTWKPWDFPMNYGIFT